MKARRAKSNVLSVEDAAYLAGIVDGEGTISARITNGYVDSWIEITSTDKAFIEDLCAVVGVGCVNTTRRSAPSPRWKQSYKWRIPSCSIVSFLSQIQPYLRLKRRQADLMMALMGYSEGTKVMRRPELQIPIIDSFRLLNQRGVAVQLQ